MSRKTKKVYNSLLAAKGQLSILQDISKYFGYCNLFLYVTSPNVYNVLCNVHLPTAQLIVIILPATDIL
jgi:hypothetical protein